MKKTMTFTLSLWAYFLITWVVNLVQLTQCDFINSNWKPEIIHGIGLMPIASGVTCWM